MSTIEKPRNNDVEPQEAVLRWLQEGDPAIRWQVMQDLLDESPPIVAAERARIEREGWGARLLDLQGPDGRWGGLVYIPNNWIATMDCLWLLRELGLDPQSTRARKAVALVRDYCTWGPEFGDSPFFAGEVEPCINGRVLAMGAYFGEISEPLLERLLGEQLEDGGWNCAAPPSTRSSFHSTICVLEGLLAYEKAKGTVPAVTAARLRGQEYLLERGLFRSRSTGDIINQRWLLAAFPNYWHYDIFWGLDYLRRADATPDPRAAEAIELVRNKQDATGRWPLENIYAGDVHFHLEDGVGQPSRWITLRALRVLKWYSGA